MPPHFVGINIGEQGGMLLQKVGVHLQDNDVDSPHRRDLKRRNSLFLNLAEGERLKRQHKESGRQWCVR
jgi:hypothetical protein